jgi:NADP-dependent 3-hydroxy acid dehydrogenase YdfG
MNLERMEMIAKELKERVITIKCDVTVEEDVKKAMYSVAEQWGTIHVALACAGVAWPTMTLTSKASLDTAKF